MIQSFFDKINNKTIINALNAVFVSYLKAKEAAICHACHWRSWLKPFLCRSKQVVKCIHCWHSHCSTASHQYQCLDTHVHIYTVNSVLCLVYENGKNIQTTFNKACCKHKINNYTSLPHQLMSDKKKASRYSTITHNDKYSKHINE